MFLVLIIFACVWICVCFLDFIFKTCMFFPYIHALRSSGITIKPFTINCYTTVFNRTFQKLSRYQPHFIRKWFETGTVVTCLIVIPAVVLLIKTATNVIFIKDAVQMDGQILQPVIPGVNLPVTYFLYYFSALLFCSIVHEIGHALAAVREGVQLQGCGLFMFGIIPGAYVDLPSEQLLVLSRWQQLNIICAGIWHNIVLVLVCAFLLFINPLIFSAMFKMNSGITVIDVAEKSGLGSGLNAGDQIYSINECFVKDTESWNVCIVMLDKGHQPGYCASKTFVSTESSDVVGTYDCVNDTSQLPFRYMLRGAEKQSCLPVRKLLALVPQLCKNTSLICLNSSEICVTPVLPDAFRIFQIKRRNLNFVLFVGLHSELSQYVTVSPWISKFHFMPTWVIFTYETLLQYIASFSGALALLNAIPCPKLDGQWLCCILVEVFLSPFVPGKSHRRYIAQGLMTLGCFLITITIIAGVYQLL